MISSVDGDSNGEIDFDEFLILMGNQHSDPDQELRNAFKVFDTDNSGSISREELQSLMTQLGQNLSDAEIDAMMEMVDENNDGEISFEEFKKMMVRYHLVKTAFILYNFCKKDVHLKFHFYHNPQNS